MKLSSVILKFFVLDCLGCGASLVEIKIDIPHCIHHPISLA